MPMTRRMMAALLPLSALTLGGCTTTLSPAPGAAYGSSPSVMASPPPPSQAAGGGAAEAHGPVAPMIPAKIMLIVEKTAAGYVLATGAGHAVYWDGQDKQGSGKSACSGGCLSAWPPVQGKPFTGSGVRLTGALGTITRPGGTVQATYNGYPLYTYAADTAPGQASGNGEGGVWHVVTGTELASSPVIAAADAAASKKAVAAVKAGLAR